MSTAEWLIAVAWSLFCAINGALIYGGQHQVKDPRSQAACREVGLGLLFGAVLVLVFALTVEVFA